MSIKILIAAAAIALPPVAFAHETEHEPAGLPSENYLNFYSKNRKFYIGGGAEANFTFSYDFNSPTADPNAFIPMEIPMHPDAAGRTSMRMSVQQTAVWLDAVALPGKEDQISVSLKMNLMGDGYAPQLYYAVAKWRGITAGYGFGMFTSDSAFTTIDFQNVNCLSAVQSAIIDYQYDFSSGWSVGAGLEYPLFSATYGRVNREATQRVPDIPVRVQYSWGDDSFLGANVMLRNAAYYNEIESKVGIRTGWGAQLYGNFAIAGGLRGAFQATLGEGIASEMQDAIDAGLDLAPSMSKPGKMNGVKAWGGFAGLQYNFTPSIWMSGVYGHLRAYNAAARLAADPEAYSYSQYAVGNVFWQINRWVRVGAEYLWGRRANLNGDRNHDSRVQLGLQVRI